MKRLALVAAFVIAAVAVFSTPPAHAQTQCGTATTCFGTPKQQIRIGGPLMLDKPVFPSDSTKTVYIDGGLQVSNAVVIGGAATVAGVAKLAAIDAGVLYVQGSGPLTRLIPFNTGAFDFASVTTTCNETGAIAVTGAQTNDGCIMGIPSSGGSANAIYDCYVSSAGNIKVRHCAVGTADDPASATYFGFVMSSQ